MSEPKRKPTEISVDEYLWAAGQQPSLKALARFLNVSYSNMHRDLHKRGIFAHVRELLDEQPGKPGPKKPPMPLIKGTGPHADYNVEEIKEAAKRRSRDKLNRDKEKKDQHIRFPHGPVCIVFVGDQHIGNAGTDIQRMYDEQRTILEIPGAYVWQMGDIVDNFIIGKLMAENMKPASPVWEQWIMAGDYLRNFSDKLLAVCGGNHEAWTLRLVGIDFTKEVTPRGVLYDADEINAMLHVGGHEVLVRTRHKWTHRSQYNHTHGQEWSMRFEGSKPDVYVGAHYHTGAVARETIHDGQRKISLQTGTYKMVDDYARVNNFPGHDASTAVALVIHDSGSMFACADLLAVKEYMTAVYPASPEAA
jgi:hypothetical protein